MNEIVVNVNTSEQRFAFLQNKKVEHIYIDQPAVHVSVNSICVGIVKDIVDGMNAAFIDIGEEKLGFIHRNDLPSYRLSSISPEQKERMSISRFLHKGEKVIVQVKKEPVGDKGSRLTGLIEWPGTHLVYLPFSHYVAVSKKMEPELAKSWRAKAAQWINDEEGLLLRTSCQEASEEIVFEEFLQLKQTVQSLIDQLPYVKPPLVLFKPSKIQKELETILNRFSEGTVWVDQIEMFREIQNSLPRAIDGWKIELYQGTEGIFSFFNVEKELEKLLSRNVWLPNGASLTIDETEALSSIDVNTGKFIGKSEQEKTILETNHLAAIEAARQIRLRDLAGIIVIDFIDMWNEEQRKSIRDTFIQEVEKDFKTVNVGSFHELGLLILTRKRTGLSLKKQLTTDCLVCKGTGRVMAAEALAFALQREILELMGKAEVIRIQATPDIIECFLKEPLSLKEHLEKSFHIQITFDRFEHPHAYYRISRIES